MLNVDTHFRGDDVGKRGAVHFVKGAEPECVNILQFDVGIQEKMKLEDSCCINCGQRLQCNSYAEGDYSDECRFYYPDNLEEG